MWSYGAHLCAPLDHRKIKHDKIKNTVQTLIESSPLELSENNFCSWSYFQKRPGQNLFLASKSLSMVSESCILTQTVRPSHRPWDLTQTVRPWDREFLRLRCCRRGVSTRRCSKQHKRRNSIRGRRIRAWHSHLNTGFAYSVQVL